MIQKLRQLPKLVRQELRRALIVTQPVIIEEIDRETMRCTVAHKDDEQVLANECPIAVPHAGDGSGMIPPLTTPADAVAINSTYPLTNILSSRGFIDPLFPRHSLDDMYVVPQIWFDGDSIPPHDPGEWVFAHEAGGALRLRPDGSAELRAKDGTTSGGIPNVYLGSDGRAELSSGDSTGSYASVSYTIHPSTGAAYFIGATGEGVRTPADRVSASDQEHGVDLGDPYNERIDPATGEDTTEDADPILDPTDDTETTYENPPAAILHGPLDAGFYQVKHPVFERRAADPDVTVTDETSDAYIDVPDEWRTAGRLPPGYPYLNTTTGALMITDMTGQPIVWQQL